MKIHTTVLAAAFSLFPGSLWAQQFTISTIAGGAALQSSSAPLSSGIGAPSYAATDPSGNLYFTTSHSCVYELTASGILRLVAGNSRVGYSGDGGPATSAQLINPSGIAVDSASNVYISDFGNKRIRRISPSGIITTIAGTGIRGFAGDNGPAAGAQLYSPGALTIDRSGNILFLDKGRIRKISPAGIMVTVAGNGIEGYSGDGGIATAAEIFGIGLAVDGAGNIYFSDFATDRIRKVSVAGIISTMAGNGDNGSSGDGGSAAAATLNGPGPLALDGAGNLYIGTLLDNRIRKVSPGGVITTVAGKGTPGFSGDGGPAINAELADPFGIAVDMAGNIFIADNNNLRIRKIAPDGTIHTVAGNGTERYSGDGAAATAAQLNSPIGVAVDGIGNVYVSDAGNNRVRKISPGGIISTFAGNGVQGYSGDGGPAVNASLNQPYGLVLDGAGNLYIADSNNFRIRKVSKDGSISTIAGDGTENSLGDGGLATNAELYPLFLAMDASGNLYASDEATARVRKISPAGTITTVAGNGIGGYAGDGGLATNAQLRPGSLTVDRSGNLYIADIVNALIRRVSPGGIITTFAGNGQRSSTGDGGPANLASLNYPYGIEHDNEGNLYISDAWLIRKISVTGIISTVAGFGGLGYSGDGGYAVHAQLNVPVGLTLDISGKLYVADLGNDAIRLLVPTNQSVFVSAVVDAASEKVLPVSPGKIIVIYGEGLGPASLAQNQPSAGAFGTKAGGTTIAINGVPAPVIYASATQAAAVVPYEVSGSSTAQVVVTSSIGVSSPFTVAVAPSSPSFFSANATGAGQIAAVNLDGSLNDASHPVAVGGYISLYATGAGQTSPPGVDGALAAVPYPKPLLPVQLTIGGVAATPYVTYAGAAPGEIAGLMQIVAQIPPGVQPGGYVPVVMQVGNSSTTDGAAWIAVAAR